MKIRITHKTIQRELKEFVFDDRSSIRIGRAEENDIRFDAPEYVSVSGRHAEIRVADQSVSIEDLGSKNGTVVNGVKITRARLTGGEIVELGPGGASFQVEILAPEGSAPGADVAKTELVPAAPQKKYGERTVGMMIQRALLQAGLLKRPGTTKSTEYFEALVET